MRPGYLIAGVLLGVAIIFALSMGPGLFDRCQAQWPGLCGSPPLPVDVPQPELPPSTAGEAESVKPDETPSASENHDAPAVAAPAEPILDDAAVRVALSLYEAPGAWLAQDALLSRAATLLVTLADGQVPRKLLGPIRPSRTASATPLSSRPNERRFRLVDDGEARFGPLLDVVLRVPPAQTAALFGFFESALLQEFATLDERRTPRELLREIVQQLENTPTFAEPPVLLRPGLRYRYADQEFEGLSDLEKTFIRLGPVLRERVLAYGQAVLAELE